MRSMNSRGASQISPRSSTSSFSSVSPSPRSQPCAACLNGPFSATGRRAACICTTHSAARVRPPRAPMPPLSPNRWRAISPYLDQALEIPTEERASWRAPLRPQDAALAADLETLLDEHDVVHQSHFLEDAILDSPPPPP